MNHWDINGSLSCSSAHKISADVWGTRHTFLVPTWRIPGGWMQAIPLTGGKCTYYRCSDSSSGMKMFCVQPWFNVPVPVW